MNASQLMMSFAFFLLLWCWPSSSMVVEMDRFEYGTGSTIGSFLFSEQQSTITVLGNLTLKGEESGGGGLLFCPTSRVGDVMTAAKNLGQKQTGESLVCDASEWRKWGCLLECSESWNQSSPVMIACSFSPNSTTEYSGILIRCGSGKGSSKGRFSGRVVFLNGGTDQLEAGRAPLPIVLSLCLSFTVVLFGIEIYSLFIRFSHRTIVVLIWTTIGLACLSLLCAVFWLYDEQGSAPLGVIWVAAIMHFGFVCLYYVDSFWGLTAALSFGFMRCSPHHPCLKAAWALAVFLIRWGTAPALLVLSLTQTLSVFLPPNPAYLGIGFLMWLVVASVFFAGWTLVKLESNWAPTIHFRYYSAQRSIPFFFLCFYEMVPIYSVTIPFFFHIFLPLVAPHASSLINWFKPLTDLGLLPIFLLVHYGFWLSTKKKKRFFETDSEESDSDIQIAPFVDIDLRRFLQNKFEAMSQAHDASIASPLHTADDSDLDHHGSDPDPRNDSDPDPPHLDRHALI